ncbi:conserved hypothetical protein [Cupriavidus taiwanensis]|nr:conserved hypothetical protein [Cupriavidus taiwanensis]
MGHPGARCRQGRRCHRRGRARARRGRRHPGRLIRYPLRRLAPARGADCRQSLPTMLLRQSPRPFLVRQSRAGTP